MGCEPSNQMHFSQSQTVSQQNQFVVNYRQFVSKDRGDVCQFYHFSKIISRSATSIVRKVVHRSSKLQRVCKIIPLSKKDSLIAMREVQTLRRLDHPNIVKIQQYFLESSFLYIIMEEVPGNPFIKQVIASNGIEFSEVISVMRQLLSAVQYIHKQNFVHRLINPDNLLLVKSQEGLILKIIDFSQASVKDIPNPSIIPKGKNNQLSNAPQKDNRISKNQLEKLDIWGCGLILYSLLSGRSTKDFNTKKEKMLQQLIEENEEPLGIDLLKKMLEQDPAQRITAQICLKHQFFSINRKINKQKTSFMFKNLLHFESSSKLKSLFYMYASLNVSDFKDKSQYLIQFHNLDKNKDGSLDFAEVVQGLENTFNIEKQQATNHAQQIFKSLDKNNNRCLDYSQFVMGTMAVNRVLSEQNLKKMFQEIDTDNNGKISQRELNAIFQGIDSFRQLQYEKKQLQYCDFRKIMLEILTTKQFIF